MRNKGPFLCYQNLQKFEKICQVKWLMLSLLQTPDQTDHDRGNSEQMYEVGHEPVTYTASANSFGSLF